MGAGSFLKRISFLLKAKGRHGTHSPFAYHFVEEVLRSKQSFPNKPTSVTQKDWDLIHKLITYINPGQIFLTSGIAQQALGKGLRNEPNSKIEILSNELTYFEKGKSDKLGKKILLFCDFEEANDLLNRLSLPENNATEFYLVVLHLPTKERNLSIHPLLHNSDFKTGIDFWKSLLLIKSTDFKQPEIFTLR